MVPTAYGLASSLPPSASASATARLDATFAALGDPTRRAILARLSSGDASVMELAAPFAMSQPAISKHLKVLERAGLIARGHGAHRRPCRLVAQPLKEATDWLEDYRRFWEGNYQLLDALLEELKAAERDPAAADPEPPFPPDHEGPDAPRSRPKSRRTRRSRP
jgi:DNA-binding transcriptional ArsR family regulator